MMIVMKEGASQEEVDAIVRRVESVGATAHVSQGELVTVIGAIGDREHVANLQLAGYAGGDHVTPITKPYKLASLQFRKGERSVLDIGGRKIGGDQFKKITCPSTLAPHKGARSVLAIGARKAGGDHFMTIAGPCPVESREVMLDAARIVRDSGAQLLRGGASKTRAAPSSFQGLGGEGMRLLKEAKDETG